LKELDGLMVNIAKVTNLSAESMENLKNSAFEASNAFGRTAQDYLKSIGEFSRAGYEGKSADLAKISLLSQNVGELTAEQANSFLLATDAAYKYKGSQEALMGVLDGVNTIDNKFATSIQKVSEGITVAGSIASNASVGVNELASAVGVMTAVTQRSGNEAGRAFRSILMNIRQIKGETEDGEIIDDDALSKSAEALNNVGIKVHELRNGVEEIRNPMEVLKELSNIWGSLSTMKTAPLIDALGGKFRGNQLVALVENFDMYEKMLSEYSIASGSAMAENEVRMGSWETKINQLRNAINSFWNNTIDTGFVKGMISGLTLLISNFGNLRTILGIIFTLLAVNKGTAFLAFLKNFSLSTMLLNSSLVQTQARLAGVEFAQMRLMSTTQMLAFATKGLWAVMIANPIGLIIGAVTAVVMIFDFMGASAEKSAKKQKEAFDELSRSISSLKQQTAEAKNLASQYESLSVITSKTTEEEAKLAEVKDRLIAQFPDLIEGYDAENNVIIGSSEAIQQAIKDNEELLKIKQEQMSNTFVTDGTTNFSQLQKDQERLDLLTQHKKEYLKTIDDINNGSVSQFDEHGNDSLAIAKNNLKGIKDELPELSTKVLESRKDLSSLADSFLQSSESAQYLGKEAITKLIHDLSSLKDESKITGEQFTTIFDGLKNSDFTSELNKAKIALEELSKGGEGKEGIGVAYEKTISNLSPLLVKLGIDGEKAGTILKDMLIIPSAQDAKTKIDGVAISLKSVIKSTKNSTDAIKEYNQILADQSNGQDMSIDKALELIGANEKMADAISIVNGAVVINTEVIKTLRQAEIDAVIAKVTGSNKSIDAQIADTQATISATQIRIQEINKEIEAINKLNAAKLSVREDEKGNYLSTNTSDSMASQARYDLGNSQAELNRLKNLKTFQNAVSSPNYGVSEEKDKKEKASPTSSIAEQVSIEESLIRSFNTQAEMTAEQGKLLEKQIATAKSANDYNLQLSLTNDLIKNQKLQITQLGEAKSKIEAEFVKVSTQSGFQNTSQFVDAQGEVTLYYQNLWNASSVETQKQLSATFDKLSKLQKAWKDNSTSVLELADSQKSLQQSLLDIKGEIADQTIQTLKDSLKKQEELTLASIETEQTALETSHQKKLDILDEEATAYEDSINKQIDAIDKLSSAEDYNKNLKKSQSEAQGIQNQINILSKDTSISGKSKLADLQKQLAEKNSSIDDMQTDHTNTLRKQNLQDQLDDYKKDIDAKKKTENTKYDLKKSELDAEKVATETTFNELMNNERYWAEQRLLIINGNIDAIKLSLAVFYEEFTKDITDKADLIKGSFQEIKNIIDDIKNSAGNLDGINMSMSTSDSMGSAYSGALTPSWGSGGKSMIVHQNELILNATETSKFFKIADILSKIDIPNILKSISLPTLNLPSFQMPQLANNISTNTTNNLNPVFNLTIPSGTSKNQAKEIVKLVYADLVKMIKK